ncbi:HYES hydrolase, partial [Anthoscopus minutus]|nr:HYES hydrolase [Anthoscopus minutus]
GFRTGVLWNSWLDDGSGRFRAAALRERLRSRFQLLLESCRVGSSKPQPQIFQLALRALQAQPQEV